MFRIASGLLLLLLVAQFIAQAADSTFVHPRGEPSTDSSSASTRTLFNIIWGCVSTIIICAWAALHPNIPPREGLVMGTLRKVELMFWTIFVPEIIPIWAINQASCAKNVRDVYNKAKGYEGDGMWTSVKKWFSFDEPASQCWTMRHGQFLIMGGFHLVEPPEATRLSETRSNVTVNVHPTTSTSLLAGTADIENAALVAEMEKGRVTILTLEMLSELVKDPSFKIQLTEDEISDRSKGDGLSKLIFVLQISWFVVQLFARGWQGLDPTHFELITAAMVAACGFTCLIWWYKPLGAQAIVYVYLTRKLTDEERNVADRCQSARSTLIQSVRETINTPSPVVPIAWSPISRVARVITSFPSFLIAAIKATVSDVTGFTSTFFLVDATHVPTFYCPMPRHTSDTSFMTRNIRHRPKFFFFFLLLLAFASGSSHYTASYFSFPSHFQKMIWLVASVIITILPLITGALIAATLNSSYPASIKALTTSAISIIILMYTIARLMLLGQAIALLRHLPPSALTAVDWAQFFPHFF